MSEQRHSDAVIGVIARCLQQRAPRQAEALLVLADSEAAGWPHSGYRLVKHVRPLRRKLLIERRDIGIGVLRWFVTDTGKRTAAFIAANPL